MNQEQQYLTLLDKILKKGQPKEDRTGVGTLSLFGERLEFDLIRYFPLLTTKKVHFKSIVTELLWFLKGDTNIKYLNDNGTNIWNEWADENGDLGPVYGKQWRSWDHCEVEDGHITTSQIDQIANVMESLKNNPESRRHIVSAWNVAQLGRMALHPCHVLFQFNVRPVTHQDKIDLYMKKIQLPEKHREVITYLAHFDEIDITSKQEYALDCQVYQRSADVFLGLPFNIASYSLLTCMIADTLGYSRGKLIHVTGDTHLYRNHVDQAKTQLKRAPNEPPSLTLSVQESIFDYKHEHIILNKYFPQPGIHASVAV